MLMILSFVSLPQVTPVMPWRFCLNAWRLLELGLGTIGFNSTQARLSASDFWITQFQETFIFGFGMDVTNQTEPV